VSSLMSARSASPVISVTGLRNFRMSLEIIILALSLSSSFTSSSIEKSDATAYTIAARVEKHFCLGMRVSAATDSSLAPWQLLYAWFSDNLASFLALGVMPGAANRKVPHLVLYHGRFLVGIG